MRTGRFFACFAATATAALIALAALTALVDPRMLVTRAFPAVPQLCVPGLQVADRTTIPYLAPLSSPREILLGDSRVQSGFSEADAQALLTRPVLNLAVPGASLEEMAALLAQARSVGTLERAWIGLTFPEARSPPAFAAPRAGGAPRLFAIRHGVLDPEAARRALKTVVRRRCRQPAFTAHGFISRPAPGLGKPRFAAMLEAQRLRFARMRGVAHADYERWMAVLDALLAENGAAGVASVLFIAPEHPAAIAQRHAEGSEAVYRRWRADVAAAARRHPGTVLLDFGAEPPPPGHMPPHCLSEGTEACPFYDPLHFRPATGRWIIEAGLRAFPRR